MLKIVYPWTVVTRSPYALLQHSGSAMGGAAEVKRSVQMPEYEVLNGGNGR